MPTTARISPERLYPRDGTCGGGGKTSTIRKVYEILRKKFPNAQFDGVDEIGLDVSGVLAIRTAKVGLEGAGDPNGSLPVNYFANRMNPIVHRPLCCRGSEPFYPF